MLPCQSTPVIGVDANRWAGRVEQLGHLSSSTSDDGVLCSIALATSDRVKLKATTVSHMVQHRGEAESEYFRSAQPCMGTRSNDRKNVLGETRD